jgi:hypothetical protein
VTEVVARIRRKKKHGAAIARSGCTVKMIESDIVTAATKVSYCTAPIAP